MISRLLARVFGARPVLVPAPVQPLDRLSLERLSELLRRAES